MTFRVKLGGLVSKLRILENHIKVREYSTWRLIFGLFLKLNKIYGAPMKPSELFCFEDTIKFAVLLFLSGRQQETPARNCDSYMRVMQILSNEFIIY